MSLDTTAAHAAIDALAAVHDTDEAADAEVEAALRARVAELEAAAQQQAAQIADQAATIDLQAARIAELEAQIPPDPEPPPPGFHRVEADQTMWSIAPLYDVTVVQLQAWNPAINPNAMPIGTLLRVVAPEPEPVAAIDFPADANIVRVTSAAALRSAMQAHAWLDATPPAGHLGRLAPRTIHAAAGVHETDAALTQPGSSVRTVGAGRDRTVLKLRDNAPGFGDPAAPRYFLKTGNALASDLANSGFCNFVQHLTVDVGNNPGAVGVRFDAANVGSLEHVAIRGNGLRGLVFETSAGPAMCRDVTIDGFDVGIYGDSVMMNNIAFFDVTVKNCDVAVDNDSKNLAFDGLVVENVGTVVRARTTKATTIIVDGDFTGRGGGPAIDVPAGSFVYLRNVDLAGFENGVTIGGVKHLVGVTHVAEWSSHPSRRGSTTLSWPASGNEMRSLNLPNRQTPDTPVVPLDRWANGKANLQAAIDSGAEVVYVPYGSTALTGDVIVRGNVRVLNFMHGELTGTGRLVVGEGTADAVFIEHVSTGATIVHDTTRDVVVRHVSNMTGGPGPKVTTGANATGDLFLEDMGPKVTLTTTRPIRVFARQMDRENYDWSNIGGGCSLRLFGDNLEFHGDVQIAGDVDLIASGAATRVEVIGGAFDAHDDTATYPTTGKAAYAMADGRMSVVIPSTERRSNIGHWVADRRNGAAVGDVTSAHVVQGATQGSDQRVVAGLYVSPP